jgi:hypothetical protein
MKVKLLKPRYGKKPGEVIDIREGIASTLVMFKAAEWFTDDKVEKDAVDDPKDVESNKPAGKPRRRKAAAKPRGK